MPTMLAAAPPPLAGAALAWRLEEEPVGLEAWSRRGGLSSHASTELKPACL